LLPELVFPASTHVKECITPSSKQVATPMSTQWLDVEEAEPYCEGAVGGEKLSGEGHMNENVYSSLQTPSDKAGTDDSYDSIVKSEDFDENDCRGDLERAKVNVNSGKEYILKNGGPLASEYLARVLNTTNHKQIDKMYGIRYDGETLCLGDSRIKILNDKIWIGDDPCDISGTKGLLELLFQVNPDMSVITKMDMGIYKNILKATNAHRQRYSPDGKIKRNLSNVKYSSVISKLFPVTKTTK